MTKLSDSVRRSGASEPYPDAITVAAAIAALELRTIPFQINETDTLAGTAVELIAPCDGAISALYVTVAKAVTTGGAVTVEASGVAVAGLSVTVADAATKGTRYSDTGVTGDGTELVRKGDRITVTPAAAFATGGAINGFVEITQRA